MGKQENHESQDEIKAERRRRAKLKREKRKSNREYYAKNRERILEYKSRYKAENPEKVREQLARSRKKRKRKKVELTPEQLAERELRKQKRAAETVKRREEWNELGWIVAKMNVQAKLSQEQIFTLLGGLASKRKIAEWCARGRKLAKIRKPT